MSHEHQRSAEKGSLTERARRLGKHALILMGAAYGVTLAV